MKRRLSLLLCAMLLFTVLAGCSREEDGAGEKESAENSEEVLLPPGPEEAETPKEEPEEEEQIKLYPQIKMLVQEYGGGLDRTDGIVEIPVFSIGGKQKELEGFNRKMQDMADEYASFKESTDFLDSGAWAEIKSYPRTTERYVQVVVKKIYFPNYATMGELYGMCFDMEGQRIVTLEDVYSQYGLTEQGLIQRFQETVGTPYSGDVFQRLEPTAFLLFDGSAEIYCRAYYQNEQGDRDEIYCYSTITNQFVLLNGTRLTDPAELDQTDPPLDYRREAVTPEDYGITDNYEKAREMLLQYVTPQLEEGETLSFINNGIRIVDGVSCYMINLGAATEASLKPLGSYAVAEDLSCVYEVDPMTGEQTARLDR